MNNAEFLKVAEGTHPLQDVIAAYLRGEVVEFRHRSNNFSYWVPLTPGQELQNCEFDPNRFKYRIAPHLVNGVEVPRPLSIVEAAEQVNFVFAPKLVVLPWLKSKVVAARYRMGQPGTGVVIQEGFAFRYPSDAIAYGEAFFAKALEADYE